VGRERGEEGKDLQKHYGMGGGTQKKKVMHGFLGEGEGGKGILLKV